MKVVASGQKVVKMSVVTVTVVQTVLFQSLPRAWAATRMPKAGRRDRKDFILTRTRKGIGSEPEWDFEREGDSE